MNNNQNYNYYNPFNENIELHNKAKSNISELEVLSFIVKLITIIFGLLWLGQTINYNTLYALITTGLIVLSGWILGAFLKWCSLMLAFTKKNK